MRYRGVKWLDDVLGEVTDTVLQNCALESTRQGFERIGDAVLAVGSVIARALTATGSRLRRLLPFCSYPLHRADDNENVLPVSNTYTATNLNHSNNTSKAGSTNMTNTYGRKSSETVLALQTQTLGPVPGSPRSPSIVSQEKSPISESAPFPMANNNTSSTSAGKQRWREAAIRAVRIRASIAESDGSPVMGTTTGEPTRQRTSSSERKSKHTQPKGTIARSRLTTLVPKLKALEATQDLAAHTALVKHLQFSPDGKYLATSRFVRQLFSRIA